MAARWGVHLGRVGERLRRGLFIMLTCPAAQALSACLEVHMDEIDLGEQLGKGGFGMVYKGTWRGCPRGRQVRPLRDRQPGGP